MQNAHLNILCVPNYIHALCTTLYILDCITCTRLIGVFRKIPVKAIHTVKIIKGDGMYESIPLAICIVKYFPGYICTILGAMCLGYERAISLRLIQFCTFNELCEMWIIILQCCECLCLLCKWICELLEPRPIYVTTLSFVSCIHNQYYYY